MVRHIFDRLRLTFEVELNTTLIYSIIDIVGKYKNSANL